MEAGLNGVLTVSAVNPAGVVQSLEYDFVTTLPLRMVGRTAKVCLEKLSHVQTRNVQVSKLF